LGTGGTGPILKITKRDLKKDRPNTLCRGRKGSEYLHKIYKGRTPNEPMPKRLLENKGGPASNKNKHLSE